MKTIPALKMDSYRRRHARRDIGVESITVAIGGHDYECLNWSPGGFRLRGAVAPAMPGDPIAGLLRFSGGENVAFAATIVHVSKDRSEFGLHHADIEIDERLRALCGL